MHHTVPSSLLDIASLERYARALSAVPYAALIDHRNTLVEQALRGDQLCSQLLQSVLDAIDARPEGKAAAQRRETALREGEDQLRRRRGGRFRLFERGSNNTSLWTSQVAGDAVQAHRLFAEQARDLAYAPTVTPARRLVLKEDQ